MLDLSVLVTCYQKEPYLDECISSILRQTKQPKEIIVVHDGCSEPMHHQDVTTIMLHTNMGVCRARHEAFRYSTGKLILFVDGDDMLSPDYIEKMTLVLSEGADVVYPDLYFFGDMNPSLTVTPDPLSPEVIKELKKVPIPVTSLMRREVYEKLGGFKDFPVLEDLDFWLRAMCNDYTFAKAQTLLWYRQEGEKRNAIDLAKKKQIIEEIFQQFIITDKKISCQKHM